MLQVRPEDIEKEDDSRAAPGARKFAKGAKPDNGRKMTCFVSRAADRMV